jgi:hypothetical protein
MHWSALGLHLVIWFMNEKLIYLYIGCYIISLFNIMSELKHPDKTELETIIDNILNHTEESYSYSEKNTVFMEKYYDSLLNYTLENPDTNESKHLSINLNYIKGIYCITEAENLCNAKYDKIVPLLCDMYFYNDNKHLIFDLVKNYNKSEHKHINFYLGYCYTDGVGTSKDFVKGQYYYTKALPISSAYMNLAICGHIHTNEKKLEYYSIAYKKSLENYNLVNAERCFTKIMKLVKDNHELFFKAFVPMHEYRLEVDYKPGGSKAVELEKEFYDKANPIKK